MNRQTDFPQSMDRLLESPLAAYADAFKHYLTRRQVRASSSIDVYVACIAEFALWMSRFWSAGLWIDEDAVPTILDDTPSSMQEYVGAEARRYCDLRARSGICSSTCAPRSVIAERRPQRPLWTRTCVASTSHMKNFVAGAGKDASMALPKCDACCSINYGDPAPSSSCDQAGRPRTQIRLPSEGAVQHAGQRRCAGPSGVAAGYFRFSHHLWAISVQPDRRGFLRPTGNRLLCRSIEQLRGRASCWDRLGTAAHRRAALPTPWCAAQWTSACVVSEVANSDSDDIDWRGGTVTLRRTKSPDVKMFCLCRRRPVAPLPTI